MRVWVDEGQATHKKWPLGNCKASQVIKNNHHLGPGLGPTKSQVARLVLSNQRLFLMTWPTIFAITGHNLNVGAYVGKLSHLTSLIIA